MNFPPVAACAAITAYSFLTANTPHAAQPSSGSCMLANTGAALSLAMAAGLFDRCSPALVQADAQLAGARADAITSGHRPNPVMGLGISNINPQVGTGNGALRDRTVDSSVRIDQIVERGGKLQARRDSAAANVAAAAGNFDDVRQRGHQSLFEAFVGFSASADTAALLREAADSYRAQLSAMRQRLAAGDVAQADVNRAELDAARAAADADAALLALVQARATLITTLGIAPFADDVGAEPLAAVHARRVAPPASPPDSYLVRADLRAAAARVDAARSTLALADAARRRDVDVSVGYDHWPVSPANPQGTGNSYSLGVSVPLFIYDSGRGGQLRARADLRAAESDLEVRRAAAERELSTLQLQRSQADALAQQYRLSLLPAAEQILAAEELAYQRGGTGLLDLLDARRNARQVAVAAVAAERDALVAAGRFEIASGRDPLALFLDQLPTAVAQAPGEVRP